GFCRTDGCYRMPGATQHLPCRRARPHAGQQVVFFSRQHGIFLCNLNFEFWNESDFRFRILATDLLVPSIAPPAPPDIDEEISKPARRSWKKAQLPMLRDWRGDAEAKAGRRKTLPVANRSADHQHGSDRRRERHGR